MQNQNIKMLRTYITFELLLAKHHLIPSSKLTQQKILLWQDPGADN